MTVTPEERSFLEAIADEPDNENLVSVFADWLMDNGQYERGNWLQQEIGKTAEQLHLNGKHFLAKVSTKNGLARVIREVNPDDYYAVIHTLVACVTNPVTQVGFIPRSALEFLPRWVKSDRREITSGPLSRDDSLLIASRNSRVWETTYTGLSGGWRNYLATPNSGTVDDRQIESYRKSNSNCVSEDFIRFAKQCRIEKDVLLIPPEGAVKLRMNFAIPLLSTCYGDWSFLGKFANQLDSDRLALDQRRSVSVLFD